MRPGVKTVTVLLLVLSLGLHWALLQTVAWAGMVVAYSQGSTVREALTKTLDGQHPCPLCKAIQKGRAEEKQQDHKPVKPAGKLDHGLVWQAVVFDFARPFEAPPPFDFFALTLTEAPPKPRPRNPAV